MERNDNMFLCEVEVEDEKDIKTKCPLYALYAIYPLYALYAPLYAQERGLLFQAFRQNCIHFDSLSVDEKFIFILTNESKEVAWESAKFVFNS